MDGAAKAHDRSLASGTGKRKRGADDLMDMQLCNKKQARVVNLTAVCGDAAHVAGAAQQVSHLKPVAMVEILSPADYFAAASRGCRQFVADLKEVWRPAKATSAEAAAIETLISFRRAAQ